MKEQNTQTHRMAVNVANVNASLVARVDVRRRRVSAEQQRHRHVDVGDVALVEAAESLAVGHLPHLRLRQTTGTGFTTLRHFLCNLRLGPIS